MKRAREIRKFHVVVVQRRQRNVQNGVIARAKLLFVNINNNNYFLPFFLTSPSSLVLLSSRNSATMVT